ERLELAFQEKSRSTIDEERRDAGDRGMRPVRRAKGVVDVGVRQPPELAAEPWVVRLFAWIETEILQQEHIAVGEAPREPLRLGADDRLGESHRLSQVALEPFPHRGETLLWIPLPFRPAEMGRDDEPGALFDQI